MGVVELMQDLQVKIEKEGAEREALHHKLHLLNRESTVNMEHEIENDQEHIDDLKAFIAQQKSIVEAATNEIDDLTGTLASDEQQLKEAEQVRKQERSEFEPSEANLVEMVDMLERAIAILEREMRGGATSFAQLKGTDGLVRALQLLVDASAFAADDAKKLSALVQTKDDDEDDSDEMGAPDAAKYENHSGGIVDTLQDLLVKATNNLQSLRKTESDAKHNFELLSQSLRDSLAKDKQRLSNAKTERSEATSSITAAKADLATWSKELKSDSEALQSLKSQGADEKRSFKEEQESRKAELTAIKHATKVLQDETGGAQRLHYGAEDGDTSFLQLSDTNSHAAEVLRFVQRLAVKQQSKALSLLAGRVSEALNDGSSDPFVKVKELISDMIKRLVKEAGEEADHKEYCDRERAHTSEKKKDRIARSNKLSSQINTQSASAAELKDEVARLHDELATLEQQQLQAINLRSEQKAEFEKNKPQAEMGLKGVRQAQRILSEYYSMEDGKDHQVATGESKTIMGFLEVIEADFAKHLAAMTVDEESAQEDFEKISHAYELSKAEKATSMKLKTQTIKALERDTRELQEDASNLQTELSALEQYEAKLLDQCVRKPEPYQQRKERRESEIQGLKEALRILEGDSFLQTRTSKFLRKVSA